MNNRKIRRQAVKMFIDAITYMKSCDLDFSFVGSLIFHDEKNDDLADESRRFYEACYKDNDIFYAQLEGLLDKILKNKNKLRPKLSKMKLISKE